MYTCQKITAQDIIVHKCKRYATCLFHSFYEASLCLSDILCLQSPHSNYWHVMQNLHIILHTFTTIHDLL